MTLLSIVSLNKVEVCARGGGETGRDGARGAYLSLFSASETQFCSLKISLTSSTNPRASLGPDVTSGG